MRKYEYPDFNVHKEHHDEFVSKRKELLIKRKKKSSPLFGREILMYFGERFRKHILDSDKKIGKYINKKKVS